MVSRAKGLGTNCAQITSLRTMKGLNNQQSKSDGKNRIKKTNGKKKEDM